MRNIPLGEFDSERVVDTETEGEVFIKESRSEEGQVVNVKLGDREFTVLHLTGFWIVIEHLIAGKTQVYPVVLGDDADQMKVIQAAQKQLNS